MEGVRLCDSDPRYVDISSLVKSWTTIEEDLRTWKSYIRLDHESINLYRLSSRERRLEVHLGNFPSVCSVFHVDCKEISPILYEQAKERLRNLHGQLLATEANIKHLARRIANIDDLMDEIDSYLRRILQVERKLSQIELRAMLKFADVVRESQTQQRLSAR